MSSTWNLALRLWRRLWCKHAAARYGLAITPKGRVVRLTCETCEREKVSRSLFDA